MNTPRKRVKRTDLSEWWSWSSTQPYPTWPGVYNLTAIADETEHLQVSDGHPIHKLGKTSKDIGGDFFVVKHYYEEGRDCRQRRYGSVYATASNPDRSEAPGKSHLTGQYPLDYWIEAPDFPSPSFSSSIDMDAYGTEAIARCAPTNPLSGLAVFLGELKEGIPRAVGSDTFHRRAFTAKSAGSEYLNVEFGWKPFISDLRSFSNSVKNRDAIIAQYEKNSGKRIKRRYTWPTETTVTTTGYGTHYPLPLISGMYWSSGGVLTRVRTKTVKRWFSGCFTYYLPPYQAGKSNIARNEQIANKLLGTRLTPEVVWELTPWSWAVDWFSNTGDVLHNVSLFTNDGLVMPYGYVMEETSVSDRWTLEGFGGYRSYWQNPTDFHQTLTTTVKQRRKATPFGFGIDLGLLTGRQNAILAALGLSRLG